MIYFLFFLLWSKVVIDLFEFDGFYYLIMVDYYFDCIEVVLVKYDIIIRNFIKYLRENIVRYCIFGILISNNGFQYISVEFKFFVVSYGIEYVIFLFLYVQFNGLVEKLVQMVKNLMKKCFELGDDVYLVLLDLRNIFWDEQIGLFMQRLMG